MHNFSQLLCGGGLENVPAHSPWLVQTPHTVDGTREKMKAKCYSNYFNNPVLHEHHFLYARCILTYVIWIFIAEAIVSSALWATLMLCPLNVQHEETPQLIGIQY